MPKIVQNVWKVSKECVRVCEGVCESVWKFIQWVQAHLHTFRQPTCCNETKIGQSSLKCEKCAWGECQSVWKCVKISMLSFSAHLHAFRYPTLWN